MSTMDNFIGRVPLLLRYILAALVLCGLILAIVVQRAGYSEAARRCGSRSCRSTRATLFRGDYVVLDYRIGTVDMPKDVMRSPSRGGSRYS